MNDHGTLGGLLPLWIIGAPFLAALFSLFTTPKPVARRHDAMDDQRPRPAAVPTGMAPGRP